MIDTRDSLEIGERAAAIEWEGYANSWNAGEQKPDAEGS
jgi:hypothetical protein